MKLCGECSSESEYLARISDCNPEEALCPWIAVTQERDPLLDDPKIYEIVLVPGNEVSKQSLRAVSHVAGIGYIEAKKAIENGGKKIFSGFAKEIVTKSSLLDEARVRYEIVPEFPWREPSRDL